MGYYGPKNACDQLSSLELQALILDALRLNGPLKYEELRAWINRNSQKPYLVNRTVLNRGLSELKGMGKVAEERRRDTRHVSLVG